MYYDITTIPCKNLFWWLAIGVLAYCTVIPEIPPEWYFPLIDLVKTTTKVNTVAKTAVFYGMNTTGSGIFCCIFHSKLVRRFYGWPAKFHSATKSYETHTSSTEQIAPS